MEKAELIVEIRNEQVDQRILFNKSVLEKIFRLYLNYSITILSIIGPANTGKSFILNYLSQYLLKKDGIFETDIESPLFKCFSKQSTNDSKTSGIWISYPFVNDDEKNVIILMDSQINWEKNDYREVTVIYSLSALLSSHLIFNCKTDISEKDLIHLKSNTKCLIGGNNEKKLQNLLILIRDWEDSNIVNGEQFLVSRSKETESLRKVFSNIRAFLLPSLEEIAQTRNFDGSIQSLGQDWVLKLKQLFITEFNLDIIPIKEILGNQINCEQFIEYFESYSKHFNENNNISYEMLNKIHSNLSKQIVKNKYTDNLKDFLASTPNLISNKKLYQRSESFKSILKYENNFDNLESSEEEKFDEILNSIYEEITKENEIKSMIIIKKYVKDVINEFRNSFENKMRHNVYSDLELEDAMEISICEQIQYFDQEFSGVSDSLKEIEKLKLEKFLNDNSKKLKKSNRQKNSDLKDKFNQAMNFSRDNYKTKMDHFLDAPNCYSDFKKTENDIRNDSLKIFIELIIQEDEGLNEQKLNEFKRKFNDAIKDDKRVYKSQFEDQSFGKLLDKTLETYQEFIDFDKIKSIDKLNDKHDLFKRIVFQVRAHNLKDNPESFEKLLNSKENLYINYTRQFQKRQTESTFTKIEEKIKNEYLKEMNQYFLIEEIYTDENIKNIHDKNMEKCLGKLRDTFPSDSITKTKLNEYIGILSQMLNEEFLKFLINYSIHVNKIKARRFARGILNEYQKEISASLENFNDLSELENLHKPKKEQLIEEFDEKISELSGFDGREVRKQLKNQFDQFHERNKKGLEENLRTKNEMDTLISEFKDEFNKQMEERFNSFQFYSDKTLQSFINHSNTEYSRKFEDKYAKTKSFNEKSKKLLSVLSVLFENFRFKNQTNIKLKKPLIENEFKNSIEEYNFEMNRLLNSIRSDKKLEINHEIISNGCSQRFISLNLFNDSVLRDEYLSQLKNNLQEMMKKVKESIFNLYLNECIGNYKNEMYQLLRTEDILKEDKLKKNHNNTKKECLDKFRNEFPIEFIPQVQLIEYIERLDKNIEDEYLKFISDYEVHKEIIHIKIITTELLKKYESKISFSLNKLKEYCSFENEHKTVKENVLDEFTDGISILKKIDQKKTRIQFTRQFEHLYEMIRKNLISLKDEINSIIIKFNQELNEIIEEKFNQNQSCSDKNPNDFEGNTNLTIIERKYYSDKDSNNQSINLSSNLSQIPPRIGEFKKLFQQLDPIGRGAFGQVFSAKKKSNDVIYAIKKIIFEYDNEDKNDIIREINVWSNLTADCIVKFYGHWFETNCVYIQMELCDDNLRSTLEQKGQAFHRNPNQPFDLLEYYISCEMFKDILNCIQYLHQSKPPIIHRDLKPENILISNNNTNRQFIKICDFGLAVVHEKSSMSHSSNVGTNKYRAPEVKNGRNYNCLADVFSTGRIAQDLFEIGLNDRDMYVCYKDKFLILNDQINRMVHEDASNRPKISSLLTSSMDWTVKSDDVKGSKYFDTTVNRLKTFENCIFYYKYFVSKFKYNERDN